MPNVRSRGPWLHRFLIYLFTVVLIVLTYWTLSFLLDDVGQFSPPNRESFVREHVPTEVSQQASELRNKAETVRLRAQRVREQQRLLRDSTDNSQRTMQQMAELERLRLQKGEKPTLEQQQAVAQAEQQFLRNQQEYQFKTDELSRLAEEEALAQQELAPVEKRLNAAQTAAQLVYGKAFDLWQLRVAAVKVIVIVPLLAIAGWLFRQYRSGLYAPLIYAFGIAVGVKTLVIVHTYFPALYFKYLVIGSSLGATVWLLVKLLRMLARPQSDWLLRQYREAYEAFLCPVCEFPIRRGPLKYLSWNRRTIKHVALTVGSGPSEPDTPYTCPLCSTKLYEECEKCHGIRHSLLPACCHCGQNKEVTAPSGN